MSEQERHRQARARRWSSVLAFVAVVVGIGAALYLQFRGPLLAALASGPEYHARFSTIGGLRPGDDVRYGGIPVGRIRSVEIDPADPSRIVVVFRVDPRTPMRRDTRASIIDATGTVTRYLSLRPGARDAPVLPPGAEVATESGPTLEETLLQVTVLLARADTLFEAAAPLLHGDFFARLDRTTARLDRMTAAVVRSSKHWGPGLERAAGSLDTVVDRTDRLLAALDSATPELRTASAEAAAMLSELHAGAAQGGGLAELMRNLTLASENLSRLAAKLDRDPASLLRAQQPIAKTAGPSLR